MLSIGNDMHMNYTAGRTTHLAAGMEQTAMAGSILMTAETLRLAEGYVQVKSLEPGDDGHRLPGQAGRDPSARRAHTIRSPGRTDSVGGSRPGTGLHV